MDDAHLTIGDVARRAGVPTSTVRYYERRGLLPADARRSGQRRYRTASLRRLVFIGMLQDAGLSLDDIKGILDAHTAAESKAWTRRSTGSSGHGRTCRAPCSAGSTTPPPTAGSWGPRSTGASAWADHAARDLGELEPGLDAADRRLSLGRPSRT
jgi:DNA-binding transcriptional MerR regulator